MLILAPRDPKRESEMTENPDFLQFKWAHLKIERTWAQRILKHYFYMGEHIVFGIHTENESRACTRKLNCALAWMRTPFWVNVCFA